MIVLVIIKQNKIFDFNSFLCFQLVKKTKNDAESESNDEGQEGHALQCNDNMLVKA